MRYRLNVLFQDKENLGNFDSSKKFESGEIKLSRVEEDKFSKTNKAELPSDIPNKLKMRYQDSIPYHRTSGASFCPNGKVLGELVFSRMT